MMVNRNVLAFVLALLVLVAGCNSSTEQQGTSATRTGKPVVAVSNYPLKYFVTRVGADDVEVAFPVEPDIDPAFWKPTAEAVGQLQKADLVFLNGAGFETWLTAVTLSESKLVDTTRDVQDQLIKMDDAVVHQHGPEGEHTHTGYAFTTWLDPQIAIAQARVVRDELARLIPDKKTDFDARFAELEKILRDIDRQLSELAKQVGQQHIIGSHPVYQYLARRMNLNMDSVHFEPDEEPSAEQWAEFEEIVKTNSTRLMLWEGEPLESVRTKLAERKIKVVVFEPHGNQPESVDFHSGMLEDVERFGSALQ